EAYLRAAEIGDRVGVTPCFEVHVNMWSEHFGRVSQVGRLVEGRGVKFNITLDHSHVIFKIDNPREQEVQGMRADVEAGRVVLDPLKLRAVTPHWIDANWVRLPPAPAPGAHRARQLRGEHTAAPHRPGSPYTPATPNP